MPAGRTCYCVAPTDFVFDLDARDRVDLHILSSVLPREGDFLATIIDALGDNDQAPVAPTVRKSV